MDPLLMRSLAPLMRRSSPRMLFQHTVSPHKSIQTRAISKLLGIGREDRRSQSVAKARTAKIRQSKPTPRQIILGQTEGRKPRIRVYPPPQKAIKKICPDPIAALTATQLQTLDPTGARTRLFAKRNPEAAKVGDILLVRQRNGDPFAGVCLNIRRRGVDTAILLRNQLTRVGVEMWYKVYSPNVQGIEIVQRRVKRARRARLYYMRQPKHDLGSVQNVVAQYLQQRQALGAGGSVRGRDANARKRGHVKSK